MRKKRRSGIGSGRRVNEGGRTGGKKKGSIISWNRELVNKEDEKEEEGEQERARRKNRRKEEEEKEGDCACVW